MSQSTALTQNIKYHFENSNGLDVKLGKHSKSQARHTALVLIFDGRPQLTIDFSASNSSFFRDWFSIIHSVIGVSHLSSQTAVRAINSALQVLPFDHDFEIELLCSIGVFEIKDSEQKKRVKNILKALLNIKKITAGILFAKRLNCVSVINRNVCRETCIDLKQI